MDRWKYASIHKVYFQKCIGTKPDIYIALLQIRSTPLGLPFPAMLLFNHPISGTVPIFNRLQIHSNNDNMHYETLFKRETKNDKNHDTSRNYACFLLGSIVTIQDKDCGLQTHGTVVGRGDHNYK